MHLLHSTSTFAIIVAGVICATCAEATVRVGGAVVVVHDVSGLILGETAIKKVQGDDVFENEFIRTAAQSKAQIDFVDRTQIELGPAAIMKIDRVVFNSNRSVRTLIVSAQGGALSWVSGNSISNAYLINTPHTIIKVMGTSFNLLVEPERTLIVLQTGKIEVCSIGAPNRCKTLSRRGETILATSNDLAGPRVGPDPSNFGTQCLSAASNCVITASVNSPTTPSNTGAGNRRASGPQPTSRRTAYTPNSGARINPYPPQPPQLAGYTRPPSVMLRYRPRWAYARVIRPIPRPDYSRFIRPMLRPAYSRVLRPMMSRPAYSRVVRPMMSRPAYSPVTQPMSRPTLR